MNTSNEPTGSETPTPPPVSAPSSQTKDPSVALSEGLLKLNWLNGLADLRQAQRANHELLAAQLEKQYGKPVMTPGEDMIAVESPISQTTNNYHPAPATAAAGSRLPNWMKLAAVALGLASAGGLGALAQSFTRPSGTTAAPPSHIDTDRAYALDFWEPNEIPARP